MSDIEKMRADLAEFQATHKRMNQEIVQLHARIADQKTEYEKRMAVAEEVIGKLHRKVTEVVNGAVKIVKKNSHCKDCDLKLLEAEIRALGPLRLASVRSGQGAE